MAQFLSGRQTILNVGVTSSTENTNVLNVIGNSNVSGVSSAGSIFSVNSNITGVSTLGTLGVTGVTTTKNLIVTGISTIGELGVTGLTTTQDLNVSGVATVGLLSATNLYVSGISTIGTSGVTGLSTTKNLIVTGISTIGELGVTGLTTTKNLIVTGISTIGTLDVTGISTLNAISAGGTTGISQYVLTSTGTGLIWQASTTLTGVTGINVAEDATDGLKYLGMQAGAGTTQVTHISSNELVYNSNTKNLGIGTTNPISKLTVQGDVKVSGVVTATEFHGILSGYASTAGIATYATDAGISTYATKAGIATNIEGGAKNSIPYQTGVNTTGFVAYGNPGEILTTDGADSAPYWAPLNVGTVVGQITVKNQGNIPVGTALSITELDFRGPNIVATAAAGGNIATITVADYVSISGYSSNAGIATNVIGGIASVSSLFVNTNGISTLGTVKISSGIVTATSGIVTYYGQFVGDVTGYAASSGIATNVIGGIASVSSLFVNTLGISTLGTVKISSGIVTATSGIVTYYGNFIGNISNLAGGDIGNIPYQNSTGITSFLINGPGGSLLQSNGIGATPSWTSSQGLTIGYANTAGIATNVIGGIASVSSLFVNTLGISTLGTVKISSGIVTATSGIVTYYGNFIGNVTGYASSSGIATNVIGGIASVSSLFVNTNGISTLGTVKISSGIVTATSGIVTYYGEFVGSLTGTISSASYATTAFNLHGFDPSNVSAATSVRSVSANVTQYPTFVSGTGSTAFVGINANLLTFIPINNGSLGIGTTNPTTNLYVIGNSRITGVVTAGSFVGAALSISGISTVGTGNTGVKIDGTTGIITSISGLTTITYYGDGSKLGGLIPNTINNIDVNQIYYPLLSPSISGTISSIGVSSTSIVFNPGPNYLGIGTTNPTANLDVIGNVKISGVSTLGTVKISSGIVTASSGIVTYYGDGSKLSNIISGVSISTNTTNQAQYLIYVPETGSTTGFGVTTTGLVVNPSNNSLGIGTSNPTANLHVLGNLLVAAGSSTGQHITQKAYELNNGTLSWEGTAGQLFSITNNLTSGSIFSVNDVSGIPSIDVNANGTVSLGAYGGNIGIGTITPTSKLTVRGDVLVSGASTLGEVKIFSGIVTSSNPGVTTVTYYGDGSKLTNIVAVYANSASNLADGAQGSLPYQNNTGITSFLDAPALTDQVLLYDNDTNQPVWSKVGLGTNTTGNYIKEIYGTAGEIQLTPSTTGAGVTHRIGFVNSPIIQGTLQVNTNLNVLGNITIGGTANRIIAQDLVVQNKDIILGFSTDIAGNEVSTDFSATGGGIAIASTEGSPLVNINAVGFETSPITYKKIMWFRANDPFVGLNTDAWLSNYAFGIGTTSMPAGTRFAAGNVYISQNDITSVRNINASGISTVGAGNTGVKIDGTTGIITSISGLTTITYYGNLVGSASTAGYARTAFTLNDRTESQFNVSYAQTAGISTNLVGGAQGSLPYQYNTGITSFVSAGGNNEVLLYDTALNKPYWGSASAASGSFGGISVFDETTLVGTSGNITTLKFVGENIRATATTGANGIATITIADNLVGTALSISGISTFSNGPVLIGTGTSTGTASQPLQVIGGAYVSGNLGINTASPSERLQVNGNISINGNVSYGSITTTTATTSQTNIYSEIFASIYRSVEYTIQATEGTNFHATKILSIHNGTITYNSEYGTVYNNTLVGAFDVDVFAGNIRLLVTPASSSLTTYTVNFVATKI